MEFLIIAVLVVAGAYFGYQYYLVKKASIDPYITKLAAEAKEVDIEKVLDVNKDGKVDVADATIIVDTAKEVVAKVKTAKKPAAKKPTMKIVK